eukprot:Opistho-2@95455
MRFRFRLTRTSHNGATMRHRNHSPGVAMKKLTFAFGAAALLSLAALTAPAHAQAGGPFIQAQVYVTPAPPPRHHYYAPPPPPRHYHPGYYDGPRRHAHVLCVDT